MSDANAKAAQQWCRELEAAARENEALLARIAVLETQRDRAIDLIVKAQQHVDFWQKRWMKATDKAKEQAASIAEMDCDWTKFGKRDIEQWDGGPDRIGDYRLGIVAGRAIAAAIRAMKRDQST